MKETWRGIECDGITEFANCMLKPWSGLNLPLRVGSVTERMASGDGATVLNGLKFETRASSLIPLDDGFLFRKSFPPQNPTSGNDRDRWFPKHEFLVMLKQSQETLTVASKSRPFPANLREHWPEPDMNKILISLKRWLFERTMFVLSMIAAV